MATVAQIIYNLEDYHNYGGLVSTAQSGLGSLVDNSTSLENYETNKIDIFTNLVGNFIEADYLSKLGIQAPPGTIVKIGDGVTGDTYKEIMIGRTGVYELDEEIAVTHLSFVKPKRYIIDTTATEKALQTGIEAMWQAEENRKKSLEQLNNSNIETDTPVNIDPDDEVLEVDDDFISVEDIIMGNDSLKAAAGIPNSEAYWNEYEKIQSTYQEAYEAGLTRYKQGVNGIYTLPNPNDINASENYYDLYNIIIDFIY